MLPLTQHRQYDMLSSQCVLSDVVFVSLSAFHELLGWLCIPSTHTLTNPTPTSPDSSRLSIHVYTVYTCLYMSIHVYTCLYHHRRKFRSQTSDNMDRWKAEQGRGRAERRERLEERRSEEKESEERNADARKGRKVAKHCVFPMICGSWGSKSRLAKAAGAEPAGQMRDEKVHAVVARSTFPSENIQNTSASDRFWKLQCRKSARRCGAKHISKSKCTKHTRSGPLLEVEMSKKCTPLWREAHFEVKMYKTHHSRTTFGSWDV